MAKDHLLQSSVGQVDEIFSLGAVTVPRLLLAKVVRCVVVLQELRQHLHQLRVNVPTGTNMSISTGTCTEVYGY